MIFIDRNSQNVKNALAFLQNSLLGVLRKRVKKCLEVSIRDYFTNEKLDEIINVLPESMLDLNSQFYETFFDLDWDSNIKRISENIAITVIDQNYLDRYNRVNEELSKIFNYDYFVSMKEGEVAYLMAKLLNINTCPYCNRIYTKTVIRKKDKKTITRPEYDHWFPKSKYPLLALSFFNLIPSCHICNGNIKGKDSFAPIDILHPYIEEDIQYTYSYEHIEYDDYRFKINSIPSTKSEKFVSAFELEDIYETHVEEIKDLIEIEKKYTSGYLQLLISKFNLDISFEEAYRFAFGVYYEPENFSKRPLSKMKKDILIELGII